MQSSIKSKSDLIIWPVEPTEILLNLPEASKSSVESCGAGEAATLGTAGVATWGSRFEDRAVRLGWTGSSLVSYVAVFKIHFKKQKLLGSMGRVQNVG